MVCVFLLYYHPRRRPEVIVHCEIQAYVRKSPELVPQRFDRTTLHKSRASKIEVRASPIILGHYVTHTILPSSFLITRTTFPVLATLSFTEITSEFRYSHSLVSKDC